MAARVEEVDILLTVAMVLYIIAALGALAGAGAHR